jgi:hypothetical protein
MKEWKALETGGHTIISVKNMKLKNTGEEAAVDIASDSICIYGASYDEEWAFLDKELKCWPLCESKDITTFLTESEKFFTRKQQVDILKEALRLLHPTLD